MATCTLESRSRRSAVSTRPVEKPATQENHRIFKTIVASAKGTGRGIVLEDLKGIRDRTTVRRKQRNRHSGWSFFQLRSFMEYKAALAGVPVLIVDPRNTSKTCSVCGHCERANRLTRNSFCCKPCRHSSNADLNAARNLAGLGRASKASSKVARVDLGSNPGELSGKALALWCVGNVTPERSSENSRRRTTPGRSAPGQRRMACSPRSATQWVHHWDTGVVTYEMS